MSFIPDESARVRLMHECQQAFPNLSEQLVLTVLHENEYDVARAYSTLLKYHEDMIRTSSQPNLIRGRPRQSGPTSNQGGYCQPVNSQYSQPYSLHSLHHSQSDPAIRHHYYPPPGSSPRPGQQYHGPQYNRYGAPPRASYPNYPTTPSSVNYRSYSPSAYPQSTSPRPAVPNYESSQPPSYPTSYRAHSNYTHDHGRELFVDVSGNAGRRYENVEGALAQAQPHAPQQCTSPHPMYPGQAVSPIDMKVPQLPFPAQSPNASPRLSGAERPRASSQDENAYASALLLQQRARMSKLHKHLIDRKQGLDKLSKEVLEKETRLLKRDNERVQPEPLAKLTERNRKLQVQIQLASQEIEHYTAGTAPLGVIDPKSQDNFHQSMTELGQAGPMRLPDNTPVHIAALPPYDRGRELDEGDQWDCGSCTFKNHPALNQCEVCSSHRNHSLPIPK